MIDETTASGPAAAGVRRELDAFAAAFGEVPKSFRQVLGPYEHHPVLLEGHAAMERALAKASEVEPSLKLLVTIKVALLLGCRVCAEGGATVGGALGISDEKLAGLADHARCAAFSERERLALDWTAAVSVGPGVVPEALRARVEAELSPAARVELAAWIAMEHYRVRFRRAMLRESEEAADAASICLVPMPAAS